MSLKSAQQMESLLARTIDGLRFGIQSDSFDAERELNAYFENLEHDLIVATESAVEHLYKNRDDKISSLNQHRKLVLDSVNSELYRTDSELCRAVKKLSRLQNELSEICRAWQLGNDGTETVHEELVFRNTLEIKETERNIRDQLFGREPLRFIPNESFFQTSDHIGRFEFDQPAAQPEPSGEKCAIYIESIDLAGIAYHEAERTLTVVVMAQYGIYSVRLVMERQVNILTETLKLRL